MKLVTRNYGIMDYSENDIIYFKNGIPAFENLKKFILFPLQDNEIFSILHSIEDNNIGLIVISPFSILKDYEIEIDETVIGDLNIIDQRDVLIINTVALNSDINKITTNLKAPIVINIKDKLGEQIILNDEKYDKYKIKYPLFKE